MFEKRYKGRWTELCLFVASNVSVCHRKKKRNWNLKCECFVGAFSFLCEDKFEF